MRMHEILDSTILTAEWLQRQTHNLMKYELQVLDSEG